jgi:hypothetical protein
MGSRDIGEKVVKMPEVVKIIMFTSPVQKCNDNSVKYVALS